MTSGNYLPPCNIMTLKVFEYRGCGTCRKAWKWLEARKIQYDKIPIREQPPSKTELKRMPKIYEGNLRRLFNTSGGDYKELNLKDKLPTLPDTQAINLLSGNGNLIKRPFVLNQKGGVIGFKEEEWAALLE